MRTHRFFNASISIKLALILQCINLNNTLSFLLNSDENWREAEREYLYSGLLQYFI